MTWRIRTSSLNMKPANHAAHGGETLGTRSLEPRRVTVRPTSLAAELGHVADNLYTRTLCGRAVYSLPFG